MNDISPREILEHTFRFWWVIAACMVLGGLAAWGFSLLHPPIYAATALYDVSLNTQQLALEWNMNPSQVPTDFASQNSYLSPVEDIFYLPDVANQMVTEADAQGITITEKDITSKNIFYIDRKGTRWFVSVRRTDPNSAAQLANLWVTTADEVIREAQPHYARFLALQAQRNLIQKCFSGSDFVQANQCAGTSIGSSTELEATLNDLEMQIISEEQAGRKIDPALMIAFAQPANPPTYPVLNNQFLILVAGALIGVLAGTLVVQLLSARKSSQP